VKNQFLVRNRLTMYQTPVRVGQRRMISEIESRLNSSYTHQMGSRIRWSHLMMDSVLKGRSVRPLEQMLKNSFRRNT
jgi:hypothetical protein